MTKLNSRTLGIVLLILAAVFAYFFAYAPVQSAKAGAASVSLSMKVVIFIPLFAVVGAIFALGGESGKAVLQVTTPEGKPRPTPIAWVVFALCIGAGVGLYLWIKSMLTSYGYRF